MAPGTGFICQPDSRPGIKTRSPPAAFPTTPSLHFSPLHSPHTAPVVPKAWVSSTFSCIPPPSTERYDAAYKKNTSARPSILIRSILPQYSLIGRPDCGSDLDNDVE